jgi:hypothetical protein
MVFSIERNKRAGVICINIKPAEPVMGEFKTQTKFRDDNDTL